MKVVIAGATGFISGAVLHHCLKHTSITSVIALSRRPLAISDPKLSTIIVEDWKEWDDAVLERIADADGIVWAVGSNTPNADVNVNYAMAFQEAFGRIRIANQGKSRLRYVHISGALVEPDQERSLWFLPTARKERGVVEKRSLEFAAKNKDIWQAFAVRPGGVSKGKTWLDLLIVWLLGSRLAITMDELGAFVANLLVNADEEEGVLYNADMVEKGRRLLKSHSE
jgi:hypothetical protein